jgi:hypothetical protein
MAVDYAPSFDRHDVRRKVGVITSADLVGRNLEVGGYLYAKDFPDIVEEIAREGRSKVKIPIPSASSGQALLQKRDKRGAPDVVAMHSEGFRLRASLAAAVERIRSLTAAMRGETSRDASVPISRVEAGAGVGGGLGMSFEVTDVLVTDTRSRVWTLMKVTFTGAAILRKEKAAYQDTWIELAK